MVSAIFKPLSNMKMVAAGSGGNFYTWAASLLARTEVSPACLIHGLPAVSRLDGTSIGTKLEVNP